MASVTATRRSGDQDIDGLLADYQWGNGFFAPILTYDFPRRGFWSGYQEGTEPYVNYDPLNQAQQAVVVSILKSVEAFTGIVFRQLPFNDPPQNAELRFGLTDDTPTAHAYTPFSDELAGDVWFNNSSGIYDAPKRGDYAFLTFLHEIGHALGLKHPHETEFFGAMELARDNHNYTVMSYRSYYDMDLDGPGYTNEDFGFPQTFMMYDIAALQHMYGADFSTNGGDTVYRWSPVTGQLTLNETPSAAPGANRVFMTVWDGGGTDTYDLSGYANAVTIDLAPGAWTLTSPTQLANLGDGRFAEGNVANALLHQGDTRSLIENAIGGAGDDRLLGNEAANVLTGGGGSDHLDGRGGADRMVGNSGHDLYIVDDPGDLAIEASIDGGFDRVESGVSFTLGAHVEHLTLTGAAAIDGTGNGLANTLLGNSAANRLDGRGGADTMYGRGGNDTYVVNNEADGVFEDSAKGGVDTVESSIGYALRRYVENLTLTGTASVNATGNGLANVLTGNAAANVLDGRGGADTMIGVGGRDTYIVDHKSDRVVEAAGGGLDTVKSSAAFALGAEVENLILTGSAALAGQGNALANAITGNDAANVLKGWSGSDTLVGGLGDDWLDGGKGADAMYGGGGNDTFVVDEAGDWAIEGSATGGIDLVRSSATFALGAHVENLTLTGTAAIDGQGNALGNALTGNAAANVLKGWAGDDVLNGGGGGDTLHGGKGNDTLRGGNGADAFIFDSALDAATNVDAILDFARGTDRLVLENAVFKGLAAGALSANALAIGAAAADADDRIVYDPATGNLFYDPDGSGAAAQIQFATLANAPAILAASDFAVI